MAQELKLEGEALSKAIDKFIDEVFADETEVFEKSKKEEKEEKEEKKEESKEEKEEKEEEKEEEIEEEKKSEDDGEEDEEKSMNCEGGNADMYKTGYMHGVEHAHGAKEGMESKFKKNEYYKKGFKAGHESATAHLEKENMKKSLSEESNESLLKAVSSLVESVSSLKSQNEELAKSVERLSKSSAGRKSLQAVDFVKKSNSEGKEEGQDQDQKVNLTLNKSFERAGELLYEEGVKKGVLSARDVAEFEATRKHSNPSTFKLITNIVNKHINEGSF